MSVFFPIGKPIKVKSSVELLAFQCQDTVVQLAEICPGATFDLHHHQESQMGMVFNQGLEMNINGEKAMLTPLQDVYVADANVPHGSVNTTSETVRCFDVKRLIPEGNKQIDDNDKFQNKIFKLVSTKDEETGFDCQWGTGSWFELKITQIPPDGKLPVNQSVRDKMGIILNGKLVMTVGEEEQTLEYGKIYYAPTEIPYRGYNKSNQDVCLIEIGI
ncbi:MAG: cupin domain-containing protein [Moorea sp. SIOASIH]|uniref:cupin domain-containing protein n=1 Tax=Moorena sp. SIOASIH TaxID=2607817 RepID=UPI0013BB6A02|nr:cupin domain-containing protein [Moorena sp. SIOASIH]NEO40838.1 cupin domain-containing protein [Moorena sp. SIOASIH]